MPPSLKRKLAGNHLAHAQSDIHAFGKLRKPQTDRQQQGKSKLDGKSKAELNAGSSTDVPSHCKKRKLQISNQNIMTLEVDRNYNASVPSPNDLHTTQPLSPIQQVPPRKRRASQPVLSDTPTKGARSCLESFAFSSSPPSKSEFPSSSPSSRGINSSPSPPSSPASSFTSTPEADEVEKLPDQLQDLVNLYSSFLTALSLHYAHNGSWTPADLRILRPTIERAWGKRRVLNDDVRRIVAIAQNLGPSEDLKKKPLGRGTLTLSDYGRGRICVDIDEDPKYQGLQRRAISEETLNAVFAANLKALWNRHNTQSVTPSASLFIGSLPLLPITACASISKIGPLLAKGQRRLENLKAGAIKAQISSGSQQTTPAISQASRLPTLPALDRNDSLLSRIRAKQLHQSTLAPPPSSATLLRMSALQRLEELAPVLEILTSSASRSIPFRSSDGATHRPLPTSLMDLTEQHGTYSFTMPTLVQHLQMSLKNPIAKEDAVRCVRLLAAEVAPSWVRIREVGKVVGVTVWRGGRIGREELAITVAQLLEKL